MAHSAVRSIVIQAAAIIGLGTVIGVVDAFMVRPIQVTREAPPALSIPAAKPTESSGTMKPPVPPVATHSDPVPTTPPAPTTHPDTPLPKTPAASGCVPTAKEKLPVGHITMDDAKKLFDSGQVTFVDTRKPDDYEAGHVQGAFRISLHDFENGDPQILNFIDRASVVVTYCVGGNCDESEAVAKQLSGAGYKKVYVMHDGFPCWQKLGYPVETGKGLMP